MPDARWKQAERRIARLYRAKRNGPTGRNTVDITTDTSPPLAVEVKSSKKAWPKWIRGALDQAGRNASGGSLPVVHYQFYQSPRRLVLLDEAVWFSLLTNAGIIKSGSDVR